MSQVRALLRLLAHAGVLGLVVWAAYAEGQKAAPTEGQKAASTQAAAPKGETVRLENDRVRVVEYVLMPGVPMGAHGHPRDRVEITLAGGRVRVTQADGKTMESEEKEGAIAWVKGSPDVHDVVNVGPTPVRAIHVELR